MGRARKVVEVFCARVFAGFDGAGGASRRTTRAADAPLVDLLASMLVGTERPNALRGLLAPVAAAVRREARVCGSLSRTPETAPRHERSVDLLGGVPLSEFSFSSACAPTDFLWRNSDVSEKKEK